MAVQYYRPGGLWLISHDGALQKSCGSWQNLLVRAVVGMRWCHWLEVSHPETLSA